MNQAIVKHKWTLLGIGLVLVPVIFAPISLKSVYPWGFCAIGMAILGVHVLRAFLNWTNRFFK